MTDEELSPRLTLRVVYHDLPDLVEIEVRVQMRDWSGRARAYTAPGLLRENANSLAEWSYHPVSEFVTEAGADTGIGWVRLRWFCADRAGHLVCHVQVATGYYTSGRPDSGSRFSLEISTEAGLVERFAKQVVAVLEKLDGEAVLEGVNA